MKADDLIKQLQLEPHPEGGYFREIYRANEKISKSALPKRFAGDRAFSTSIYFLLKSGQVSKFHRIQADEVWHFYAGSSLTIHIISEKGAYSTQKMGSDLDASQQFQNVVEAGNWFGASVDNTDSYALVGCTVAPGFDFADFEFGDREKLIGLCPEQKERIIELT